MILINDNHIDLILNLIKNAKANCYINLPNNVIAKKNYNDFVITRDIDNISSYEIEFDKYEIILKCKIYFFALSSYNFLVIII